MEPDRKRAGAKRCDVEMVQPELFDIYADDCSTANAATQTEAADLKLEGASPATRVDQWFGLDAFTLQI